MRPLVAVRRATPFDAAFVERHPLLAPLRETFARLGPLDRFPDPEALTRVFERDAPVRFVRAAPRKRRRRVVEPGSLYDARIVEGREVPTREGCWHDLMNALVWGTFPRAKAALHARQHAAIGARIVTGATALPPTRSRELDALALVDEGGVAIVARDPDHLAATLRAPERDEKLRESFATGAAHAVVFGHAVFESLVFDVAPAVVAAILLERPSAWSGALTTADLVSVEPSSEDLAAVDEALARAIGDRTRLRSPEELARIDLDGLLLPRTSPKPA